MFWLDLTLPAPAANLALEEALLEVSSASDAPGVLRCWESPVPFVVLGHSNRAAREVDLGACRAAGIPVLRRSSGGGTVVQGPGCLNYALILRHTDRPELATIPRTNGFIMQTHAQLLARLTGLPVAVAGVTDLEVGGRKFSGNAQKRGRTHLLFHGTFLLDFDLALIPRLLPLPSRQPAYRAGRGHEGFLRNVPLDRSRLKTALRQCWGAAAELPEPPRDRTERLVAERHSRPEWVFKF